MRMQARSRHPPAKLWITFALGLARRKAGMHISVGAFEGTLTL
jgi:hypothetical protein